MAILDPKPKTGAMNEYRSFVQRELDRRGWKPAEIENRGGPSRQVVSKLLKDERPVLDQRPKQETIEGLAHAFGISVDVVLAHVAMAMGFPVTIEASDLDSATDEDLLEQIRKRMNREGGTNASTPAPSPVTPLRAVEDEPAQQDSVPEQKMPAFEDLAAHPPMKLARDAEDERFDRLGEESQDGGGRE